MARGKSLREARLRAHLQALHAYQRHRGSTTQQENAAADLGMDLVTFLSILEDARRNGFDIDRPPE